MYDNIPIIKMYLSIVQHINAYKFHSNIVWQNRKKYSIKHKFANLASKNINRIRYLHVCLKLPILLILKNKLDNKYSSD